MELKFKHQKFQTEAAKAVVDVFAGQPYKTTSYLIDRGTSQQKELNEDEVFTGWRNEPLINELTNDVILKNLNKVQKINQIQPSSELLFDNIKTKSKIAHNINYNLTVEMETGVGKTYTYIKTMYELNKSYGWSKFIVIVPSVAIREGVAKTFEMTKHHFAEEYGKKIRSFIYVSKNLSQIDTFASDNSMQVMIINSQAFNASGKDARRIYMRLDEFRSRRPIDVIAKTNPILIIDEPQSVEGEKTKERLVDFNPLITLRYSATHRKDRIFNMVYRLDAMEAYNKKLVKKIAVKGITEIGTTTTNSYVYFEKINLSNEYPTATIEFDYKSNSGIKKVTKKVDIGYNLYDNSNHMEEYQNNFVVKFIDGRDNSIEFLNGIKLFVGDVIGKVNDEQKRRIQIRETILSHLERERELFFKGIKVLSLFFIDEVANYKQYDEAGKPYNGIYATMFEEEYTNLVKTLQQRFGEDEYIEYLNSIPVSKTHAGYFSKDNKGKFTNSKINNKKEGTSEEVSAYELIMKDKELLLDTNPEKSPVRFIFSHSALREGWDNPNVFQICTLKQSSSEIRKRQEVGRGLRLCVNNNGERMDANILGEDVHEINKLTVIASESYSDFTRGLQNELADAIVERPKLVTPDLFKSKTIIDNDGNTVVVDEATAINIFYNLITNNYIDNHGKLTDKYYSDKNKNDVQIPDELTPYKESILKIIDTIYDGKGIEIEDARKNNIELKINNEKLAMPQFKTLWNEINKKSVYVVNFDTEELIANSINALNANLNIVPVYFKTETGSMKEIKSREDLLSGNAFIKENGETYGSKINKISVNSNVKYDLVGKLVEETGLTRKAIVSILKGIKKYTFDQFKNNPEEFILQASKLINDQKASIIIQHITYNTLEECYDTDIFTQATIRGQLGINAMKVNHNLYDHVVYDSKVERDFVSELDIDSKVAVYVKLPNSFYISTPVGKYNPDWAIAYYEGSVKHIYFVAETKGSLDSLEMNHITPIEQAKIDCARMHFKSISNKEVVYDVVNSYDELNNKVMK